MEKFQGIIVYEIIVNANKVMLNGIYTNTGDGQHLDRPYEVNNEIAKKKQDSVTIDPNDILVGEYDLRYIDSNLVNGTLTIAIDSEAYKVTWDIFVANQSQPLRKFVGIGLKAGQHHLAVSYLSV